MQAPNNSIHPHRVVDPEHSTFLNNHDVYEEEEDEEDDNYDNYDEPRAFDACNDIEFDELQAPNNSIHIRCVVDPEYPSYLNDYQQANTSLSTLMTHS